MGLKKETQRETSINLKAGIVYCYMPTDGTHPNTFQIRNNFSTDTVYVSTNGNISDTSYEINCIGGGTRVFVNPRGGSQIYFYAKSDVQIQLLTWENDDVKANDLDQTQTSVIVNSTTTSSVIVTAMPPLASGTNHLGSVGIDGSVSLGGGSSNIGNVGLNSAIPSGDNNIGNVDLASSIPAGDNNIGNVDLASPIPTGTNKIGKVDVDLTTTPMVQVATTPHIYTVTCTSANTEYNQVLPTNTKKFTVMNRGNLGDTIWDLYFSTGASSTMKFTGNTGYEEENILLASQTLYFKSTVAGDVIQILAWT